MSPDDYDAMCEHIERLDDDQLVHDAERRLLLESELKEYLKSATKEQLLERLLENDAKLMDAYKNMMSVLHPIRHFMECRHAMIREYNSNLYPTMKTFNLNYDQYLKLRGLQAGDDIVFYEDGNLDSITRHRVVIDDAAQLIANLLDFFSQEIREPGSIRKEYYHTYHKDNEHVLGLLVAHLGNKKEVNKADIHNFKYRHCNMGMNNLKIMDVVMLGIQKGVLKFQGDLTSLLSR